MSPFKSGLHKKISTIFDGVPVNKSEGSGSAQPALVGPEPAKSQLDSQKVAEQNQQQTGRNLYKDTAEKKAKSNAKPEKRTKKLRFGFVDKLKNKLLLPGGDRKRQIITLVMIPLLCLVFIVVIVKVIGSSPPKKKVAPKSAVTKKAADDSSKIVWKIPQLISDQIRDPMNSGTAAYAATSKGLSGSRPGSTSPADSGEIVLMGIVHSKEKPMAIIGQHIVSEGEKINDFTVVKINEHSVDIEKGGQKKTLKVGQKWSALE
jgi:hypothetical protein